MNEKIVFRLDEVALKMRRYSIATNFLNKVNEKYQDDSLRIICTDFNSEKVGFNQYIVGKKIIGRTSDELFADIDFVENNSAFVFIRVNDNLTKYLTSEEIVEIDEAKYYKVHFTKIYKSESWYLIIDDLVENDV